MAVLAVDLGASPRGFAAVDEPLKPVAVDAGATSPKPFPGSVSLRGGMASLDARLYARGNASNEPLFIVGARFQSFRKPHSSQQIQKPRVGAQGRKGQRQVCV